MSILRMARTLPERRSERRGHANDVFMIADLARGFKQLAKLPLEAKPNTLRFCFAAAFGCVRAKLSPPGEKSR
jgi:hypothetical protein